MPDYLVSWQIEVTADTPEEAAIEAYNMLPFPGSDSEATVFDVREDDESPVQTFDIRKLGR